MSKRLDLSPWARKELGPDGVNRLFDLVPSGCHVSMGRGRSLWVATVTIPGQAPARIFTDDAKRLSDHVIEHLQEALPGVLVG